MVELVETLAGFRDGRQAALLNPRSGINQPVVELVETLAGFRVGRQAALLNQRSGINQWSGINHRSS